jgi:hypothetical protein
MWVLILALRLLNSCTAAKFTNLAKSCQSYKIGRVLPKTCTAAIFYGLGMFSTSSVVTSAKVVFGCQFHEFGRILQVQIGRILPFLKLGSQLYFLPYTKINTDMFLNLYYGTLLIPKHSSTVFQKAPIPSTSLGMKRESKYLTNDIKLMFQFRYRTLPIGCHTTKIHHHHFDRFALRHEWRRRDGGEASRINGAFLKFKKHNTKA